MTRQYQALFWRSSGKDRKKIVPLMAYDLRVSLPHLAPL